MLELPELHAGYTTEEVGMYPDLFSGRLCNVQVMLPSLYGYRFCGSVTCVRGCEHRI